MIKKLLITGVTVLALTGAGVAYAMNNVKQNTGQPTTEPVAQVTTQPVTIQEAVEAPVVQEVAPAPTQKPKPVVQPQKTPQEFAQAYIAEHGQAPVQWDCFSRLINSVYGWDTMTIEKVTERLGTLGTVYNSYCSADNRVAPVSPGGVRSTEPRHYSQVIGKLPGF